MATALRTSWRTPRTRAAAGGVLLAGAVVSVVLGVYGAEHRPALRPLWLFGFSGMLQAKSWLATAAVVLVLLQVATALWMFGRLPGAGAAPRWVAPVHRWSGAIAFVLLVPVALHCLWSLGFSTATPRLLAHSIAGCTFYGAYVAKMLGLRLRGAPGWLLPLLGGLVFAAVVLAWFTGALWFFTRSGLPLT
jgi:hypothetical protein